MEAESSGAGAGATGPGSNPSSLPIKRACDACRARKVRRWPPSNLNPCSLYTSVAIICVMSLAAIHWTLGADVVNPQIRCDRETPCAHCQHAGIECKNTSGLKPKEKRTRILITPQ
ncbi:hypothetical protein K456DRAFT_608204 [Colletotrichum gloeosporioides 23]|nr:hypothetical protein K456DRAFT_608204 [Colletotrichum gloeosporioides 23]